MTLINPAYETAKSLKELLKERDMESESGHMAEYKYYVSDMEDQFLSFADRVLPCHVEKVQPIDIERY